GIPGNPAPCRGSRVDLRDALDVQPGNHAAPPRAMGRGPAAVRRVPPDPPARLRPRPPGHAPGGERPGRAPARPAPAGGGPGAVRGGPEGTATGPRPDERGDGPGPDQPSRRRAPPGSPR